MENSISLPTLFPDHDKDVKRYKTEEGKEVKFKTILGGNNERADIEARPDQIRQESLSVLNQPHQLAEGEYAAVERKYKETGYFDFTSRGDGKIQSYEDVAFMFRQLESEAVEHAFAVYVDKENKPTVQWLSMGTSSGTIFDVKQMFDAVEKLEAKKLFFIHNHPSGNLEPSKEDRNALRVLQEAFNPRGIDVRAIIINLQSGKYSVFNTNKEVHINNAPELYPYDPNENKVSVLAFTQQAFLHSPQDNIITKSMDVAKFLSQQRFASGNKTGWALLNQKNNIVGNFFQTEPITQNNIKDIGLRLAGLASRFNGKSIIGYGNEMGISAHINELKEVLKTQEVDLLDYIVNEASQEVSQTFRIYRSLADDNILREPRPGYRAGSNEMTDEPWTDQDINWGYFQYERETELERKGLILNSDLIRPKNIDMANDNNYDYQLVDQKSGEKQKGVFLRDLFDVVYENKNNSNAFKLERVAKDGKQEQIMSFELSENGTRAQALGTINQTEINQTKELAYDNNMNFEHLRYMVVNEKGFKTAHSALYDLETALKSAQENNLNQGEPVSVVGGLDSAAYTVAKFEIRDEEQHITLGKMVDADEQYTVEQFAKNEDLKTFLPKDIETEFPVYHIQNREGDTSINIRGLRESLDHAGNLVGQAIKDDKIAEYTVVSGYSKVAIDNINGMPEISVGSMINKEEMALIESYAFDKGFHYEKPQTYQIIDNEKDQPSKLASTLRDALHWAADKQHLSADISIRRIEDGDSIHPIASFTQKGEVKNIGVDQMATPYEMKVMANFARFKDMKFQNHYGIDNTVLSEDHKNAISDHLINWYETNRFGKKPMEDLKALPKDQTMAFSKVRQHLEHDWEVGRRNDISANSKGRKPHNPTEGYIREWVNLNDFNKKSWGGEANVYDIDGLNRFFKDQNLYEVDFSGKKADRSAATGTPETPEQEQEPETYQKRNLNYLTEQLKYLGFSRPTVTGEEIRNDLAEKMAEKQASFSVLINHKYFAPDKPGGNKDKGVVYSLNFTKGKDSDMYFFNDYTAYIIAEQGKKQTENIQQNFGLKKGKGFTAKEAFNLLSGRSVYKEMTNNETGEKFNAWMKLKQPPEGQEAIKDNRNFSIYNDKYGFDLEKELSKAGIKEMNFPEQKDDLLHSLKKGNIQAVTVTNDKGEDVRNFVAANPQFKTIDLYHANGAKQFIDHRKGVDDVPTISKDDIKNYITEEYKGHVIASHKDNVPEKNINNVSVVFRKEDFPTHGYFVGLDDSKMSGGRKSVPHNMDDAKEYIDWAVSARQEKTNTQSQHTPAETEEKQEIKQSTGFRR